MEGDLSRDQAFIKKLTGIILSNLENEQFGVEELSREMGMSHTTIHRRLRSYTHLSISQFIREVRLQKAHEMLVKKLGNVSEISYRVGFGSPTYFVKCFHEYYGYPPGELKKAESRIHGPGDDKPDLMHLADRRREEKRITNGGKWNSHSQKRLIIIFGVTVGLLLTWALYLTYKGANNSLVVTDGVQGEKSIAVLPFKNLSADEENEYFADGVALDIYDHLSKIKGLKVISATTSDHFKGSTLTVPEIAKSLGVDYVLEGSAQVDHNMTRVMVRLVDAKRDRQLLSESFDREMRDIFSVQSEIAQNVAAKLEAVLSPEEIKQIGKIPTQSTEAHICYLKGRYFWNIRTEESLTRSIEYFEKSIAADPAYAVAYAGLADAYYTLSHNDWMAESDVSEGFGKAKDLAHKALAIDPDLAEAHAIIGGVYAWGEWQWEKARVEYLKAIKLNPNYSTAYFYYAELLDLLGENEEARKQLNIALELDPLSRVINHNNMLFYYNQGNFHEALKVWNEFNEMGLAFFDPHAYYFYIYMYLGEDSMAYKIFCDFLLPNIEVKEAGASYQEMYNRSGPEGILEWFINNRGIRTKPAELFYLAKWYAVTGKRDESLDLLEKVFQAGFVHLPYVYNSWDFRNLRNEPRFRNLMRQMNFPEYK